MYEENKKAQLDRWRLRTANSPLRLDQNEIHRHLMDDWKHHFRAEKKHKHIKTALKKMTGKPEFDICSENYIRSIDDPEKRLAMERRKLLLELGTIKKESGILQGMVESSIGDCERLFPQVAMQIAHGHSTTGMSINSSLVSKQKVSAEDAARMQTEDNRVYSAAGRYDEFGRFILTDSLKTKAGMVSAEYALASGKSGVSNEFKMVNSYSAQGSGGAPSRSGSFAPSRQGSLSSESSNGGQFLPRQISQRGSSPKTREDPVDIGSQCFDSLTISSNEPSYTSA